MYFMDQGLYIFDVIVVVFSDRFSQTAGTLLHNAHRCGIPVYLVRTKADHLVRNVRKDRRRQKLDDTQAREILKSETQQVVNDNLTMLNLPIQPVYLVSQDGMREWVREGNVSNTMDEQRILNSLLSHSKSP
ncbi:hypothetical protein B0H34DRAFT_719518 [Crassisporium funariophilum]|nr:hypothetical protein B0H34DRAFT_719518 [Crassisporium funariophilum]